MLQYKQLYVIIVLNHSFEKEFMIPYFRDYKRPIYFPPNLKSDAEGIVAVGANLLPKTILNAYVNGYFPWYSENDPILWWSPDPRFILYPEQIHISKKMKKILKSVQTPDFIPKKEVTYTVTFNESFADVILECANKRGKNREGTWIFPETVMAYKRLFERGYAHSVEVWSPDKRLVGGMYGVAFDKVFFGESMFCHENNTSKIAIISLCKRLVDLNCQILDCQVYSQHLQTLGAIHIAKKEFENILEGLKTENLKKMIL